ncbi:MAG: hypothetical protein JXQ71_12915 [Verrucomicrobia bacterium]|nr:hypothetical protein [Verrucomicrobiota bacterium]
MKSNSLLALLVGALWVCGLMTLWVSTRYFFSAKELQEVQLHMVRMTQTRNATQALAMEAVNYSKAHPALVPVLQQFELVLRTAPTNSPQPETAPPVQP